MPWYSEFMDSTVSMLFYGSMLMLTLCCIVAIIIERYRYKKMSVFDLKNKHVVITGGSSGIGKCLAVEAIQRGANVTIIARDEQKLNNTKRDIIQHCIYSTQRVFTASLDLSTNNYEEIEKAMHSIEQEGGPIFMLFNCAGMAICGKLEDISPSDIRKLHDLNCLGSIMTTRAVIEGMKSRGEGHIIFVSSQSGLIGIYGLTAYSASKFALRGFAEALQMEVQTYGIKITIAYPPDTDTPGFAVENQGKPKETKLICQAAGLFQPEVVAGQMFRDALAGMFASTVGADGFMVLTLTTGMSPCRTVLQLMSELFLMSAFRVVAVCYLFTFKKIIENCMVAKNKSKKPQ
ncbi:3-ketodihydrosphingosine reductase [Halyomorpha halys]|uniref:3-ketodihydrosphingosine reductase n=1 Tax=Halyomorpha halys TaxID=286706 RepID=UPI0006D4D758|nr:3-ketodihydrosphingosine reductase [Halyomorpha halys]XP_014275025.1 3-ketodihydrosphingosine reductase [Halyomorpha halys]